MSDEEDLQERENVTRLDENPAFQRKAPDVAKEYIAFLDEAITLAAPPDLFGSQKNPNAWFNLQSTTSRDKFAEITVWIGEHPEHPSNGEINHKLGSIIILIKQRFNNPDAFKEFNSDIGKRIKRLKENATQEKFTTKDIPDGRWFANSGKDNVVLSYAVSNARNIQLSCDRLPVTVLYDPFDGTYRIERAGTIAIVQAARQVRSDLLVPIADAHGYEMRRDSFDDWIEGVKNDKARHYDSLIQYYDSFEAHYDSDFKCIDEMIDICDTDNDEYTREGLRSFIIGHVQRAYFPGCELQRIISLIGDENIGKSSLIKIKAGNLEWDEKGGIKALRWYSNKQIINPLMSDRDRHFACIGINIFEFDERRGQKAIEAEHFRSFVTSTYDDFRIWMGMEPVRVLRRWDVVASANYGDYNTDRFIRRDWGINVGVSGRRINLPKFIELYSKISAWAVHQVNAGMSAIPDYGLYEKAKIKQRTRIRQTDTMDFLEPVFAFAHIIDSEIVKSKGTALHLMVKCHISYKDDETKNRTYMIDQMGLSNFAGDYKRFYNRSGNTDKHAVKNDILNVEVRPIVNEATAGMDICYTWQKMDKPENMWSSKLNRAIRGYLMVVDAPHVVLMEAYALSIIDEHLSFIEAWMNLTTKFDEISKPKKPLNLVK